MTQATPTPQPPIPQASTPASTPTPATPRTLLGGPLSRPVTLADLTDDLLWPKLLRVPSLALRGDSLIIAFLAIVVIGALCSIPTLWANPDTPPFGTLAADVVPLNGRDMLQTTLTGALEGDLGARAAAAPTAAIERLVVLVKSYPLSIILVGVPSLLVLLIAGLAISRMAACELALGVHVQWPAAVGFALARARPAFVAVVAPLLIAVLIALALAIGGFLFLRWPILELLGAVLYPLALLGGLLIVLIVALFALGGGLLIPAVACDGCDGIEAIQRAYAYVPGRALRFLLYALILLLLWTLAGSIAAALAEGVNTAARSTTRAWFTPDWNGNTPTDVFVRRALSLWEALPLLCVRAFALSFFFSGVTVLYLLLRKVNDGQDITELWTTDDPTPTSTPSQPNPHPHLPH